MGEIKDRMMQKVMQQLAGAGEQGFKNLQDKINRVNQQNDMIIDTLNEVMKGQIALWKALKLIHAGDKLCFDKVEKELKIRMEVE